MKKEFINKIKIINSFIRLIVSILLCLGPVTLFKVCDVEKSPMKCYFSAKAVTAVSIILIVASIIYFFTKTVREKIIINILTAVTCTVIILIPALIIGGCKMKTMACQAAAFPAYYVLAGILVGIAIIEGVYLLLK